MNKKVQNLLSGVGIVSILFFSSCGGSAPKEEASSTTVVEETVQVATETVTETASASDEFAAGKKIYMKNVLFATRQMQKDYQVPFLL